MCFLFPPKKRQHINRFDPTRSRDNPEICLCLLVFSSPDKPPKKKHTNKNFGTELSQGFAGDFVLSGELSGAICLETLV